MLHQVTYLCPFRNKSNNFNPIKSGWVKSDWPPCGINKYNFDTYFPKSFSRTFSEHSRTFTRNDIISIAFYNDQFKAIFDEMSLFQFSDGTHILALKLHFARSSQFDLGELDEDDLLDAHESYRRFKPHFAFTDDNGHQALWKFQGAVLEMRDNKEVRFSIEDKFWHDLDPNKATPWTTILDPINYINLISSNSFEYMIDSRMPSHIFAAIDPSRIDDSAYIYRILVGDGADSFLPTNETINSFISESKIDDYFFPTKPNNSVRYFVGSHFFVSIGTESNGFFTSIIKKNHDLLYFSVFLISWYQYSYLLHLLDCLQNVGGRTFADRNKKITIDGSISNRLLEEHTGVFMPTMIGEAAMNIQLFPFRRHLTDSLHLDALSAKIRHEMDSIHQRRSLEESGYLSRVAFYIGITAVISLMTAIIFGILGADSEKAISNIKSLPGNFKNFYLFIATTITAGLILISGISALASKKNKINNAIRASLTYTAAIMAILLFSYFGI